ncbi:phosphatase PAP2 family protein [Dactylosporangium darangshiense]|uniref:Phosphatase PAP2 family protein n=1 Tax=Dactylosporangium darangshiense TaxID=579108 RepID=A0ABP8DPV7_9ACTN
MIGEILVVVLLVKVYDLIRSLAAVRAVPARRHGAGILSVERLLHLDWESAGNRWLTSHPPLGLAAAYWYEAAHVLVTLGVLVWCYVVRPDLYRPMRNALVITNVVGMTVFFLFPVMPPRLLPGGGYTDSVADAGFGTTHGGPVPADQYAAMPSLHLAWAVWTACVAAALLASRRGRALCYLYTLTTAVVVVVTANHFILDVVAGVAVGLGAIAVARALPLVSGPLAHRIRRCGNTATNALGSSGTRTVTSRYPTTAATAVAGEIPTAMRPPSRVTSSAPMPPGDGTAADQTIR